MGTRIEWCSASIPATLINEKEAAEFHDQFGSKVDKGNVALQFGGVVLEGTREEITGWLKDALALVKPPTEVADLIVDAEKETIRCSECNSTDIRERDTGLRWNECRPIFHDSEFVGLHIDQEYGDWDGDCFMCWGCQRDIAMPDVDINYF